MAHHVSSNDATWIGLWFVFFCFNFFFFFHSTSVYRNGENDYVGTLFTTIVIQFPRPTPLRKTPLVCQDISIHHIECHRAFGNDDDDDDDGAVFRVTCLGHIRPNDDDGDE